MKADPKSLMLKTLLEQYAAQGDGGRPVQITEEQLSEIFGIAYACRQDDDRTRVRAKFWQMIEGWLA